MGRGGGTWVLRFTVIIIILLLRFVTIDKAQHNIIVFHTDSVEFFGRDFADARVRTGNDGGLAVQSGGTRAFTAEHFDFARVQKKSMLQTGTAAIFL